MHALPGGSGDRGDVDTSTSSCSYGSLGIAAIQAPRTASLRARIGNPPLAVGDASDANVPGPAAQALRAQAAAHATHLVPPPSEFLALDSCVDALAARTWLRG